MGLDGVTGSGTTLFDLRPRFRPKRGKRFLARVKVCDSFPALGSVEVDAVGVVMCDVRG